MSRAIAVEGDVVAIPGSTPYPPATSGAWSPGSVTYSSYDAVSVGGKSVIYKAECSFTFTGIESASGSPVTGEESVTLEAGSTAVNADQNSVLVMGDSAQGIYGNQLMVVAANPASTNG